MPLMPLTKLPQKTWEHIDALFEKYEDGVNLSQVLDSGYPGGQARMPEQYKDRFEATLGLDPDAVLPLSDEFSPEK